MEQKPKMNQAIAALIVIVLVGIVTTAVIIVSNTHAVDPKRTAMQSLSGQSNDSATVDTSDTSTYKNGTYSATGTYLSPGGRETLAITVTIKNGVITDTTLKTEPATQESALHQQDFANNYKVLVVGKKINGLSLSRVAGSSLTSNGFNDALTEIRSDAKA